MRDAYCSTIPLVWLWIAVVEVSGSARCLLFAASQLEQPFWRISRHPALYPALLRLPAEVSLSRQHFTDMVAVMEEHMQGRQFIVGTTVTVADLVCAYTLDWANEVRLL